MLKQIKDLKLYEIDYFVAKAEAKDNDFIGVYIKDNICFVYRKGKLAFQYSTTTNPSQAWPIIEQENICIEFICSTGTNKTWYSKKQFDAEGAYGKTSLESAMRCYVASIYYNELEI